MYVNYVTSPGAVKLRRIIVEWTKITSVYRLAPKNYSKLYRKASCF